MALEIKKNLKSLDVKISKLANDLGISRPTLDSYIECFENGEPIPNELYQDIFDYLFANPNEMNSLEFAQKFDHVKRIMLKDAEKGAEKLALRERESALSNKIKNAVNSGLDTRVLKFVNLFVSNSKLDLVKGIIDYFNYINGYEDMNDSIITDKDKKLYSQLKKVFESYQDGTIELNEEKYDEVYTKNQASFEKKKVKIDDSDIIDYIQSNLDSNTNIDMDVLKKMIASRKKD